MLQLRILQEQWLILAMVIGLVLVLAIVASYIEIWRPRKEAHEVDSQSKALVIPGVTWLVNYVPWVVALLAVAGGLWGLLYAIDKIVHPPNW